MYVLYTGGKSLWTTDDGCVIPVKVGVPSLLGLMGGRALFKDGFEGGSTLRCASSGGTWTGCLEVEGGVCLALSFINLPREAGRCASDTLLGGGAVAGFRGRSSLGIVDLAEGLTVEFDDEVDDSRTGGRPNRLESFLSLDLLARGGLLRVGLCCRRRGVVATTAGE